MKNMAPMLMGVAAPALILGGSKKKSAKSGGSRTASGKSRPARSKTRYTAGSYTRAKPPAA